MNDKILQIKTIERMAITAVLLDRSSKTEYKYQQTVYIENVTKRMYEENLKKTNFHALLTEMHDQIENAYDKYLESDEGKNSKYAYITERNKRIIEDEKCSIIANVIEEEYGAKLNDVREKCKVNIKEVFPDQPIEAGDIVYSIDCSQLTEDELKEMASPLVKEWSKELILTNEIATYEVETKIYLTDGNEIESFYIGSTFE